MSKIKKKKPRIRVAQSFAEMPDAEERAQKVARLLLGEDLKKREKKVREVKKLSPRYNLAVINPTLAKQWHPKRNNSTPREVTPNSSRKIWWRCPKNKNHVWKATINDRANGRGCPYCVGRLLSKDNSLFAKNPKLSREWHLTKNGDLTPKDVHPNTQKKVWWQCSKNKDDVWKALISHRNRGSGCPHCNRRGLITNNCFSKKNPKLAAEWFYQKNGKLKPDNVSCYSNRKAWWRCSKDKRHIWRATILNRSNGTGCPLCKGYKPNWRDKRFMYYY